MNQASNVDSSKVTELCVLLSKSTSQPLVVAGLAWFLAGKTGLELVLLTRTGTDLASAEPGRLLTMGSRFKEQQVTSSPLQSYWPKCVFKINKSAW